MLYIEHLFWDEGFPGGSVVKHTPVNAKDTGSSLGWENPLGKEKTTHTSILVWEMPWQESLVGYSPWGHERVDYDLVST